MEYIKHYKLSLAFHLAQSVKQGKIGLLAQVVIDLFKI
ncbi:hypothetical protein HCH_04448 [Hahella chejuensis KCTC 2396]|uniref:Uncharacterized protein n=1 Tax=Hahella chejuensis (strain KCTC 2396) TaxID=349521 RepID=Q2SDX2_HAHCH|nr:hypothetical protein HCH_04448 [Hahella chejuensis KCTC 2396]